MPSGLDKMETSMKFYESACVFRANIDIFLLWARDPLIASIKLAATPDTLPKK